MSAADLDAEDRARERGRVVKSHRAKRIHLMDTDAPSMARCDGCALIEGCPRHRPDLYTMIAKHRTDRR